MLNDRFKDYDDEVRTLVNEFENTILKGQSHFFDTDEIEVIIDFYLETADLDKMETAILYAENLYPGSAEVRLRRSHLYSARNQFDQSLAILSDLERKDPTNTDVAYALGALYSMTDHPEMAIAYFQKAAADGYMLGTVYANIADEYYKLNRYDDAARFYKKAVAAGSDDHHVLLGLLDAYSDMDQPEAAADYFRKMVEREPYSHYAWYCLAEAYYTLGMYEHAIDAFEYAIAIDKTFFDAYMAIADCYEDAGQPLKAVESLRRSLDYAEHKEVVSFAIGSVYLRMNNCEAALPYFKQAEQEIRATALLSTPLLVSDLYASLADCYRAMGEYYLAVQSATTALTSSPDPARVLRFLGSLHEEYGEHEQAELALRGAIEREPEADENWTSYIDYLIRAGRYADALDQALQGAAAADDGPQFAIRFAAIYFRLGQRNSMFHFLLVALQSGSESIDTLLTLCPEMADDPEVGTLLADARQR
ncbi:MAG: tetratricopeptide repeat protein [Bacteroidales bacterium]|nr:tetratricopeptide repeat protein [Bacteroidales bacterium]